MVRLGKKWLTLLVAALLTLGTMALFTACGPTDPDTPDTHDDPDTPPVEEVIDWSSYTVDQFKAEDFDGKTISYQYTGVETQMNGQVLLNLYEDGSACAVHQASTSHNRYYGYWSEAEDEDGNAITLTVQYLVGMGMDDAGSPAEKTAEKNKTYPAMYELSDGTHLTKSQGVALAKQGGIRGVAIASRNGSEYLRSLPDGDPASNLGDLPSASAGHVRGRTGQ